MLSRSALFQWQTSRCMGGLKGNKFFSSCSTGTAGGLPLGKCPAGKHEEVCHWRSAPPDNDSAAWGGLSVQGLVAGASVAESLSSEALFQWQTSGCFRLGGFPVANLQVHRRSKRKEVSSFCSAGTAGGLPLGKCRAGKREEVCHWESAPPDNDSAAWGKLSVQGLVAEASVAESLSSEALLQWQTSVCCPARHFPSGKPPGASAV